MSFFNKGQKFLLQMKDQAQRLEERVKARYELSLESMVSELRRTIEETLSLKELSTEKDLLDAKGRLGLGRIVTNAWQSESFRKLVLSHIELKPVIEGFALTIIPKTNLEYPVFATDLMALPTRLSLNADVYGLSWTYKKVLEPLLPMFDTVDTRPGPLWAGHIASDNGFHAKLPPSQADKGFEILITTVKTYLSGATEAQEGADSQEGQKQFFEAFHENGPRQGPLSRVMGKEWSERYSRLLFS